MRNQLILIIVMAAWCLGGGPAHGADTTISYQGRLDDGGSAADGPYDMTFTLWNASAGGAQVGSSFALLDVPVSAGLFTVELDFGADAFDNSARWLEIIVEGTTLSPRQPMTRAPYAIQTRGIFVDEGNDVGLGTAAPEAPLHVHDGTAGAVVAHGNSIAVLERAGEGFLSILTPDTAQRGILFGDPESFVNGSIIFNNGGVPDGFQFRTGGNIPNMVIDADGNVGIGTQSPMAPLEINASASPSFLSTTNGDIAMSAESTSNNANAVYGFASAFAGPTYGVYGRTQSPDGTGVLGWSVASTGNNIGVYGVSNSGAGWDFYAGGAGQDYGSSSSIRWKSSIRNIDQPLDRLAALRGVYFDWDQEHGGHHDVGMIAEEVGEVLPEIVNYEENGVDAIGMDYSKMTPLLVEAVNALRAEKDSEIAGLTAENIELRGRLSGLEAAVAALVRDSVAGKGAPH